MISPSVVESFETITSMYTQQLAVNDTKIFAMTSLTLYTEMVSENSKSKLELVILLHDFH